MSTARILRRPRNPAAGFSSRVLGVAALCGALLVSACGGGSGGSMGSGMNSPAPTNTTNGVALVTLTDMPGDFLSYKVKVVSLQLTRFDGTTVETVPASLQVDFAQLVNLSEIVSAQQVPDGSYTGVALTLDYNGATLIVDNGAGGITVPAANIINGTTMAPLVAPNSQVTLAVQLATDRPLVINQGTVANLALDFNLAASNTVAPSTLSAATAASAVTVTVSPMLSASITPDTSKQIHVRGPLVSVSNTSTSTSYTISVRPFFSADADDGQLVVYTTATTAFTLNGASYTGNAGLTALAGLATGTLTAATGTFDTSSGTFTAATVYAGTSVAGAGLDSVEGTVVARSGNTLTLSNGFLAPRAGGEPPSAANTGNSMGDTMGGGTMGNMGSPAGSSGMQPGDDDFSPQILVTLAPTTTVTEVGQSGTFGPQDISVGQHVRVFGTFSTDASGQRTLDATAGSAQLMLTAVWGRFSSSSGGVVTVGLLDLDRRPGTLFDFSGTGSSSANDATAAAYTVSVPAALQLPTLTAGFPVQFFGFVTPFGAAPPDFAALSLVDYATMNALLRLEWAAPGVTAPFAAPLSATNVMMTQATLQSAATHVVQLGPVQIDPSTLASGLAFVPNSASSFPVFAIGHRMSWKIEVFSTFGDFVTALTTDLDGTTALLKVAALGPYNQTTGVMSVNQMAVELSQ